MEYLLAFSIRFFEIIVLAGAVSFFQYNVLFHCIHFFCRKGRDQGLCHLIRWFFSWHTERKKERKKNSWCRNREAGRKTRDVEIEKLEEKLVISWYKGRSRNKYNEDRISYIKISVICMDSLVHFFVVGKSNLMSLLPLLYEEKTSRIVQLMAFIKSISKIKIKNLVVLILFSYHIYQIFE
jgi:hypothetical protein